MTDREVDLMVLEALEKIHALPEMQSTNNGTMEFYLAVRSLDAAIIALRERLARQEQEPLGYWNAVEGWVELPESERPAAWVYPEGLEALQQGKPWTAYGTSGDGPNPDGIKRIPLYTAPQPADCLCKKGLWCCKEDCPRTAPQAAVREVVHVEKDGTETWRMVPAVREWQGLTDDEIDDIYLGAGKNDLLRARAIEAKLKEKNK